MFLLAMETMEQLFINIPLSSTKAAEIYRQNSGGIYYICYHCGIHMDNIADTLTHIELHFPSENLNNTEADEEQIVKVKYEFLNDSGLEVDSNQLKDTFVDCNESIQLNEENDSLLMEIDQDRLLPSTQLTCNRQNPYADLDGLFEWKCLYCPSLLTTFFKLNHHLIKIHMKEPLIVTNHENGSEDGSTGKLMSKAQYLLKCILCSSEFIDSRSSRLHLKSVHNAESTKCMACDREFVSTELLADHIMTVHSADETKTSLIEMVQVNAQDEINDKPLLSQCNTFLCILCDKTFNGTFNLMQHTFVHFNLKAFRCIKCPAKFQQQTTVYDHMQKKHFLKLDEIVDDMQCMYCNEKAKNLFEFVTHIFTHHLDQGERNNSDLDAMFNYDCRFCFANFNNWNNMRSHLFTHSEGVLPTTLYNYTKSVRCFSDRAKSGMYPSEFLYNCIGCSKTLCGSFEARNHWITEHKSFENHKNLHKIRDTIIQSSNNIDQQKESFKCQECDHTLISKVSLMQHMLVHFQVKPYTCSLCSKKFSVSRNAIQHMIRIHQLKPDDDYCQLDCHYCKAEFTEPIDFITHMFNDHLYEHFSTDENLDGQCKYECQYCKEIFIERNLLSEHLENHKDEMIPELDSDKGTSIESSTKILRHKIEFVYMCLHCPKKFHLPNTAREHVKYKHKTEHKNKTRKRNGKQTTRDTHCDLCNITFITWRSMLNHRAKRHPETHKKDRYKNRQVHYCSTCGKAYQDKGNLNQHEATHTRHQSYSCDICNKSYRTKYYIRTHMLSHTNEKNFICHQCGRSFYSVSKLNTHNQIHENLNLKCDQCEKVFFTRYNLTKHRKTHNDTRRKCKLCDNYFKSNNSYRTHMLLHTGIKKYACRYCDMTFAQSSGRRGHEKIRHHVT